MTREITALLEDRLRRYRGWTSRYVAETTDEWLYRRVEWTECTIGWHLGHLAWKQDSYGLIYFGEAPLLDEAWRSGFYSETPLDISSAPSPADLRATFDNVFERFMRQVATRDDGALTRSDPDWPDDTILGALTNVIFHEGEHLAGVEALHWYFSREG